MCISNPSSIGSTLMSDFGLTPSTQKSSEQPGWLSGKAYH